MFRVIIHQQAKEDISRNANWWADNHSIDQALSWIDTVEKQLQDLSQNPYRFGFADENGLFQYEIRQVLVGPEVEGVIVVSLRFAMIRCTC